MYRRRNKTSCVQEKKSYDKNETQMEWELQSGRAQCVDACLQVKNAASAGTKGESLGDVKIKILKREKVTKKEKWERDSHRKSNRERERDKICKAPTYNLI